MKLYARLAIIAVIGLGGVLAITPGAQAASTVLNAYESSDVQTSFTLNFPGLGINSTSNVFFTRYQLELDEEAGTAKFLDYNQQIESLAMPLGVTTGVISVKILDSNGTYNPANGTFVTNDTYEIRFTNDLTDFGFTSPVILPATSRGTVTGGATTAQTVDLSWQGEGQLENSQNPTDPYEYVYTCRSRTTVARSAADVPPLPTTNSCGPGLFGFFGFATIGLMFAGRTHYRRRR